MNKIFDCSDPEKKYFPTDFLKLNFMNSIIVNILINLEMNFYCYSFINFSY